jgi:hypothetical protein
MKDIEKRLATMESQLEEQLAGQFNADWEAFAERMDQVLTEAEGDAWLGVIERGDHEDPATFSDEETRIYQKLQADGVALMHLERASQFSRALDPFRQVG